MLVDPTDNLMRQELFIFFLYVILGSDDEVSITHDNVSMNSWPKCDQIMLFFCLPPYPAIPGTRETTFSVTCKDMPL